MNTPGDESHSEPPGGLLSAFVEWLADAQPRLAVAINIDHTAPDGIEFSFALANPVLHGWLADHGETVVAADWADRNWDFLLDLDVRPAATADGFVCTWCQSEGKHQVFPTLAALWRDHLFDPLEEWINTTLAGAYAVALNRTEGGGSTYARLVPKGTQGESSTFLIAL